MNQLFSFFLIFNILASIYADDIPPFPLRFFGEINSAEKDYILKLKIENTSEKKVFLRRTSLFEPKVHVQYIECGIKKYSKRSFIVKSGGEKNVSDKIRLSEAGLNILEPQQVQQLEININRIIDSVLLDLERGEKLVHVAFSFENCVLATGVDFKTIDEVQFGTVYYLPKLKILQPFEFGGLFFEERERRVCVRLILPWSSAQGSGLMKGDVIKEVNGTRIDKMEDLEKAIGTDAREASFSIAGKDGIKKMVILRGEAKGP